LLTTSSTSLKHSFEGLRGVLPTFGSRVRKKPLRKPVHLKNIKNDT
jgi:hypothetical protein